ncbi:MAG TPA: ARMT1-like domain-containing protein [Candidatus Nanoarchaeia archaeon]|nr:ARMT1-like domain-containing protein [Candidatus Nanoarchaeia archaeon]
MYFKEFEAMNVQLDCIFCIQRQALEAVRLATIDVKKQEKILKVVMAKLLEINWNSSPPDIADVVYNIIRKESKEDDPYKIIKKECNDIALRMYPELKRIVDQSATPLLTAARLAIAGNVIDYGTGNFDINKTISLELGNKFRIDHFSEFVNILEKAENLVYLTDNAGEIVFDKILLETIISKYKFNNIFCAVKVTPFINDTTLQDAEYVGIDSLPGVEILNIGVDGNGLDHSGKTFTDIIAENNMIISKGQRNYETLPDNEKIFHLLIAKCPFIAKELGVQQGDFILKRGSG